MKKNDRHAFQVFSTCPMSSKYDSRAYVDEVAKVCQWSEELGCEGILVYTDNSLADPWLVSQIILQHTEELCPLVAVQPVYMHPYTAAKMVATLGNMYGRRLWLNMLAGGFKNDLESLNDTAPHDDRYLRTTEYTLIIRKLLESDAPVNFEGRYYKVVNLKMTPTLPAELFPGILISGSSEAGMAAAKAIGAVSVKYPKPPGEEQIVADDDVKSAIRVGIIARRNGQEAWSVALERFPEDRKGRLTHKLAMKVSDSQWHKQLSEADESPSRETYWLGPFKNYRTFCPYLVGSYDDVAAEVAKYRSLGFCTIILDIPPSREELVHTHEVFQRAGRQQL